MVRGKSHKKDNRKTAPSEVTISAEEYDLLTGAAKEKEEFRNKWLKVHADYENTRKRLEKEKADQITFANEGIISRLFVIMDNFDMAFDAMEKAEDKTAVMEGIKMVQKEFHGVLEENGVEKIETEGKDFDPNYHEAVMAVETDDTPDGAVLEEVRTGYMLNKRLLRPSQVIVAKSATGEDAPENVDDNDTKK